MAKKDNFMCPLFPDQPCPRGEKSAKQCEVRVRGDYDPMSDYRDYLLMNCALNQAQSANKKPRT